MYNMHYCISQRQWIGFVLAARQKLRLLYCVCYVNIAAIFWNIYGAWRQWRSVTSWGMREDLCFQGPLPLIGRVIWVPQFKGTWLGDWYKIRDAPVWKPTCHTKCWSEVATEGFCQQPRSATLLYSRPSGTHEGGGAPPHRLLKLSKLKPEHYSWAAETCQVTWACGETVQNKANVLSRWIIHWKPWVDCYFDSFPSIRQFSISFSRNCLTTTKNLMDGALASPNAYLVPPCPSHLLHATPPKEVCKIWSSCAWTVLEKFHPKPSEAVCSTAFLL